MVRYTAASLFRFLTGREPTEGSMKLYPNIGIQIPDILLPKSGINPTQWAVIACDQYTSQPEYWQDVAEIVGDAPSTLHLVLPEVFLGETDVSQRIQNIQQTMHVYLERNIFESQSSIIYVERFVSGKKRKGIILALDLEHYDFSKGSSSLIRATEGTIIERLPPRIKIREGAALEFPHILVLIDDPELTVIEPVSAAKEKLTKRYDFELMLNSGHLAGYAVDIPEIEQQVLDSLHKLASPGVFCSKYNVSADVPVLLFAMGDGNHSLATAKAIWEKMKTTVGMDHPARFALVEIENVHDEGLIFEPIHRVMFNLKADILTELKQTWGDKIKIQPVNSLEEMQLLVNNRSDIVQRVGAVSPEGPYVFEFLEPETNLAVGTLQTFLDKFLVSGYAEKIDYVHGFDILSQLGKQPGNFGLYLPTIAKSDLFKTVILDGALPRKTFSMGEAHEKRFYMEGRKLF
jgi:hypothetical protein